MLLQKSFRRVNVAVNIMFKFLVDFRARLEEIHRAVLAILVRASRHLRQIFSNRRAHRPDKRMNRAQHQDRHRPVPICRAQCLLRILRRMRLKRPRRVGAQFIRYTQTAQQLLRFQAARNHHRVFRVPRAHALNQVIHVPRVAAIGHRQFIFRRGQSQRANHHGGQRIREFALEHRAFTGNHAVVGMHFAK